MIVDRDGDIDYSRYTRREQHRYCRFARILSWVGWGAFGVSLAWGVFA